MEYKLVEKGIRLYNYIIDLFAIALINALLLILILLFYPQVHDKTIDLILFPAVYLGYYFFLEYTFGKTIGKMITKSCVVYKDGQTPKMIYFIIRTFLRIFPLDSLSILLGTNIGMHDQLSNTRVVHVLNRNK